MINLEDAANAQERLALEIFKAMEDGNLLERMPALCTEDFVWANSGLPKLQGQSAVFALMTAGGFRNHIPILSTQTHFSADLLHIASRITNDINNNINNKKGVVFTERIDHHWDAAGRDLMTPHIAGVIDIVDNRITALRDFYDVACYQQTPTDIQPEFTLERFRARAQPRR